MRIVFKIKILSLLLKKNVAIVSGVGQMFVMRSGKTNIQLFGVILLCGIQMLYGFSNLVICLHEGTSSSRLLAVTNSNQEGSCGDHHCADSEKPSEVPEHHHACEDLVFQAPLSPCPRAEDLTERAEGTRVFFSISASFRDLDYLTRKRLLLRTSSSLPPASATSYCDHVCFRC